MRHIAWIAAAMFAASGASAGELDRLAWLAGHWVTADGAAEEHWLQPRGGSMTGQFRWVFPNGRQVLEYLVIEETEDGVTFRFKHYNTDFEPWEKGEPNTYRLAEATANSATFELLSSGGKVPARMQYRREQDNLTFTGAGAPGEEPLVLRFERR